MEVEIDAFTSADAVEVADDIFAEGDCGTHRVTKMDVVHIQET